MKKMTKKTLANYRKKMDDFYDFMSNVIGNKTVYAAEITRWNGEHGEYLSFEIAIADPETHAYGTDKSFHEHCYSNYDNIDDLIARARQFVMDNYTE